MNDVLNFNAYLYLRESLENVMAGDVPIPRNELSIRFDASGGPGGQNVNKLATKATLKWEILKSVIWRDKEAAKQRFLSMFRNRINKEGQVVLQSQAERNQRQNMNSCIDKLQIMIAQAMHEPAIRTITEPTQGSIARRLKDKNQGKEKRLQRKGNWQGDW